MEYTTLAKVKEYLGITNTDNDAILTTLISQVSQAITGWIGRDIFESAVTNELYDGGDKYMFLRKYPVAQLDSTPQYRTGTISNPTWQDFGVNDYLLYENEGYILFFNITPTGRQNVRVSYTGGYSTVPLDLELLANQLVAKTYSKRNSQGVTRVSIEGSAIEYGNSDDEGNADGFYGGSLTGAQEAVIKKYTDYSVGERR